MSRTLDHVELRVSGYSWVCPNCLQEMEELTYRPVVTCAVCLKEYKTDLLTKEET